MGYKRFGCTGKDYEAGHLFYIVSSFTSYLLLLDVQVEMNDGKETEILSESTFVSKFINISWSGILFPNK